MSHPLSFEDILFRQRVLSCSGLYSSSLDGLWGPKTDAAERRFFEECDLLASADGTFDARSERNIRSLRLPAQGLARRSLQKIRDAGLNARIISGTRTYPEQTALYRQGRFGNPPPRVTNAKAGQSWHNFGLAWDVGIFRADGSYIEDGPEYDRAGAAGKISGVEWGGDWTTFKDKPHFQAPFGVRAIGDARNQFERGGRP